MATTIVKRDGREEPFVLDKIAQVIQKAFTATVGKKPNEVCLALAEKVNERLTEDAPTVEHVQDLVEAVLIDEGHVRTAKAFILYRAERTRIREINTGLMRVYDELTSKDAKDSDIKRENANINGDTAMGTMYKFGSEGAKKFYELCMLRPEFSQAHKSGDIHIHDLDFFSLTTTCCQIDLEKLLAGGWCSGHGFLREPKDIQSYSALACIAIQSNQNDQHGGQSIVNFDYSMAHGVRKTFIKRYRLNMERAVVLLAGDDKAGEAERISGAILEGGATLRMDDYAAYQAEEIKELLPLMGEADAVRAQKFALSNAISETDRATFQAMEAFVHNLNTMHSRAGSQVPFSTINYGMDTSPEGRMVIKNVLLATEDGLGHGETAIFPIHIFRVKEGVNYFPDDPSYDLFKLAIRVSAKRLFPNFSFQDASFNKKYYVPGRPETEIAYMGCRTRVIGNVYDPAHEISNGRGNLSFTSINLPRLAIKAKGDVDTFFESLDRMIDMAVKQLYERYEIVARKTKRNFPVLMGEGVWLDSDGLKDGEQLGEVLKHGTLSIGFIGLAETLTALVGKHHGQDEKARNLGYEIIAYMRRRIDGIAERERMNYTLLATPAEGLSGRFVRLDRELYGVLPGVTDREYYTNSFHVPVYYPICAADKLRIEAPYHALTNAGHISYVELDGDPTQNLDAFEKLIRLMHDLDMGYGSVNHPVDRDPVCGFTGIIGDKCPLCGRTEGDVPFERIRRVTGYLTGTLANFNNAKLAEVRDRLKHGI